MSRASKFPTVATIIGCPEQLSSANGLVATPLAISGDFQPSSLPDDTSQVKDPVQRAVLDNICGKLPTKNPVESMRCEVCQVECNGLVSYNIHVAGSKHQKKLKEQKMKSFAELPFITEDKETKTFHCTYCNTTLNAISQIEAHIEGSKHKSKMKNAPPEHLALNDSVNQSSSEFSEERAPETSPRSDPNELYCALCNIHANSKLQLAQHTVSPRHLSKQKGSKQNRFKPYNKNQNGGPYSNPNCALSLGTGAQSHQQRPNNQRPNVNQRPWVREGGKVQYYPTGPPPPPGPPTHRRRVDETSRYNENDEFRW